MVQRKHNRALTISLAVLTILLVAIGTIVLIRVFNTNPDPLVQQETSSSSTDVSNDMPAEEMDTSVESVDLETPNEETTTTSEPELDPATVNTIDIEPMELTVSYVKGSGGFEYEVLRTTNGTRYVEFRSPTLIGTKCTNDEGAFASILANPDSNESTTLTKTTTVEETKYGLSLESSTCTSDEAKLQAYQKSFSDAFSLLKKMN